jgi:multidrug resistance efflux pump
MSMKTWKLLNACLVTLFMVVLAGCAIQAPAPEEQVSLAAQSIAQAESSGAVEFAPVEIKSARDKLSQAKLAMNRDENLKAKRLADEAMVDANLAEAKARSAKSQKVVEELKESIRVLQQEMNR